MTPRCVKTGCGLVSPSGEFFWGDLHQMGWVYIFNAVVDAEGQSLAGSMSEYAQAPVLTLHHETALFGCRGVFVFPVGQAEMNAALADYLGA